MLDAGGSYGSKNKKVFTCWLVLELSYRNSLGLAVVLSFCWMGVPRVQFDS